MNLPPAFALLAACCRWPPSAERDARVQAAADGVDWAAFFNLATRHRVEGLVQHALGHAGVSVPAEVASDFRDLSTRIARQSLLLASESQRIADELAQRGVDHLFLKGAVLEMLAYGKLGLKQSRDIDLLVDPAAYDAACDAAEALGYRIEIPKAGSSRRDILRYARAAKDSVWHHDRRRTVLEVHQRLAPNPVTLEKISVASPRQWVTVASGLTLPTLAHEELFTYLCVHGAFTSWSRLKWLADLAALVSGEDEDGIAALYRAAERFGAGRSAAQALLLAKPLFGTAVSARLEAELRSQRVHLFLERTAYRQMLSGEMRGAALNRALFSLQEGRRYKQAQLGLKLRSIVRRAT